jgi:hypothetical protein
MFIFCNFLPFVSKSNTSETLLTLFDTSKFVNKSRLPSSTSSHDCESNLFGFPSV